MDDSLIELAQGKFGRVVAFRLKPGADLYLGLEEACRKYGISNGVIVSAIGSLDTAYYCDVQELPTAKCGYGYGETLHITGPVELTGASGIICHDDDGSVNLHIHVSLSDRYGNAWGGHLKEGTKVLMTTDVVVAEIEGIEMGRSFDDNMGVMLFAPRQLSN
ncbi:MAG: DNA-binding protein [Oscillospiraceae bacterium]|nr:DNA-binding protein [Oscillospiraceae bacterium]MBQ2146196.1 DNA-binding protein [Oscillospiraceae bacterium]